MKKDPNAVALGRKGGRQRAKNLSPEQLSAIGRKGVKAREKKFTHAERSRIARAAAKARWTTKDKK